MPVSCKLVLMSNRMKPYWNNLQGKLVIRDSCGVPKKPFPPVLFVASPLESVNLSVSRPMKAIE